MFFALIFSLWISSFLNNQTWSLWGLLHLKLKITNLLALLALVPLWHIILFSMKLYESRRLHAGRGEWQDILKAVLIGTTILLTIAVIFQRTHISREALVMFGALSFLLTWSARSVMRLIIEWLRRGNRNMRNLILVGCDRRAYDFLRRIAAKPYLGYRIIGFIGDPPDAESWHRTALFSKYLGTLKDFDEVVDRETIDEVVISLPIRSCYEQISRIIDACETQGILAHLLLAETFPLKIARARATDFDDLPVLTLTTGTSSLWSLSLKRAFDIVAASALVIVLSPVLALTAILIKVLSRRGPVIFVQDRVGRNRRRFKMFKFRTMVPEAETLQQQLEVLNEADGPVFKIKHDPRVTPIGKFLRQTSLDELPQLFNVIKGDMSLVGPRPLPLRDVMRFEESWLKRRFSVKPGITCLWQISGRSNTDFKEWIKLDLEYIDRWSLGLDVKILLQTIPAVLRGTGAC